ncbi:hypothetical protein GW17_00032514 [Ensete ventricosum]
MVDFDRRRPISGGISREREKKKRENLESDIALRRSRDPLPVGDFSFPRREKKHLLARGEGTRR